MTANDTSYFHSDPHQWNHPLVKDKWIYTYRFLENTSYKRKRTYSDDEIRERLEQTGKTSPTGTSGGAQGEDTMVTAIVVDREEQLFKTL